MVKVIVSGAKGRMGTCIVNAVAAAEDLKLVGCFDPHCAGQVVSCADGDFACSDDLGALIDATGADVVVDFTQPGAVLSNVGACCPMVRTPLWARPVLPVRTWRLSL